jgi:signal peptide peptidase SppA
MSTQPFRFFQFLAGQPWAITQDYALRMIEIYERALDRKAKGEDFDREAVEKELGRPLDNTRGAVTIRDGVAKIPVEGPIFRRADFFTEISGASTIESLSTDLNAALENPDVKAIILYVDSPGGEVNGTSEFSDMIFAARKASDKPIIAYVSHLAASAAYWIASAADEVVVDNTASLGSIGVVAVVPDPAKQNSKTIEFVSSQSPNKRPNPNTEKGKATIQDHVDDLAQVFVDAVARNRGVTSETVVQDFGRGGLMIGQKAVTAGLADRVGSYESVLAELQQGMKPKKKQRSIKVNGQSTLATENKPMADKNWFQKLFGGMSAEDRLAAQEALAENGAGDPPAKTNPPAAKVDTAPAKTEAAPSPPPPAKAEESEEVRQLRAQAETDRAQAEKDRLALAEVQKQLAAQRADKRKAEAETFAGTLIIGRQLLPASRPKVESMFVQAALDDETAPLAEGSRVETFRAMFTDFPKHNLTVELTKADLPEGAMVLNPGAEGQEEQLKAVEDTSRAWADKQNPKPAIAAVK